MLGNFGKYAVLAGVLVLAIGPDVKAFGHRHRRGGCCYTGYADCCNVGGCCGGGYMNGWYSDGCSGSYAGDCMSGCDSAQGPQMGPPNGGGAAYNGNMDGGNGGNASAGTDGGASPQEVAEFQALSREVLGGVDPQMLQAFQRGDAQFRQTTLQQLRENAQKLRQGPGRPGGSGSGGTGPNGTGPNGTGPSGSGTRPTPKGTTSAAQPSQESAVASTEATPAYVEMDLPLGTEVFVNGMQCSTTTHSPRRFVTPPLIPGNQYHYDIVARIYNGTTWQSVSRSVNVLAGHTTRLVLDGTAGADKPADTVARR